MHSKSPSVMAFCPVCLGILPYSCQNTSRNITCEQLLNCFLQHMLVFSSTILSFVLCRIVSVIIFCWNIIRFSEKKEKPAFYMQAFKERFLLWSYYNLLPAKAQLHISHSQSKCSSGLQIIMILQSITLHDA